ncbi:MAG: alanine--tRNA ligase, partial [Anaerolineales bacterium]
YYKKEAIGWAWELLTEVWGLPKDKLWATCFEDELGEIPRDDEAAAIWHEQPGFDPSHLLFFGRGDNFWEMADTGPCGPDSEIFIDRGPEYCNKVDEVDHTCRINGDCQRFLELWNLVFIQYDRKSPRELIPLPAKHVDTGMGFDRMVSVMQDVSSNYQTDLFTPLLDKVQQLTGHSAEVRSQQLTPYRVIADHVRAATFLIADGVVPGNIGRNYVCRMIIRRASRFGSMIGLTDPFLAKVAEIVIQEYGGFYRELEKNRTAIVQTLTEEEERFHRTLDKGISNLTEIIDSLPDGISIISGEAAFNLYSSSGLPFEITRDIAREYNLDVDLEGFNRAMETHRISSSGRESVAGPGEEDLGVFQSLLKTLQERGALGEEGVIYNPYDAENLEIPVLALIKSGKQVEAADPGDAVAVVLPRTPFYVEAGGQVSDTGEIRSANGSSWRIHIQETRQPVGGLVVHLGVVKDGQPKVDDIAIAALDQDRRQDIMRNHTATHLLHAALRSVLGDHVRQAGSLVAPDRLRFDFTHSNALTSEELERVEEWVNRAILANYPLTIQQQEREEAITAGAMALFGETYGDEVRTVQIGLEKLVSYELCAGTHVHETSVLGSFIIQQEGSVAAGIRRIDALTGRAAQHTTHVRLKILATLAKHFGVAPEDVPERVEQLNREVEQLQHALRSGRKQTALEAFKASEPIVIEAIDVLYGSIPDADADLLRELADHFRGDHPSSVVVLGSVYGDKPILIAAITEDLIQRGLHAGELVKAVAALVGGGGGGKPSMAQAGGKDASKLPEALALVPAWIKDHLKPR